MYEAEPRGPGHSGPSTCVDEFLEWGLVQPEVVAGMGDSTIRLASGDVGVHRIGGLVSLQPDGSSVNHGRDCTSHASDLDLLLWQRLELDTMVKGDRGTVERFLAASDLS